MATVNFWTLICGGASPQELLPALKGDLILAETQNSFGAHLLCLQGKKKNFYGSSAGEIHFLLRLLPVPVATLGQHPQRDHRCQKPGQSLVGRDEGVPDGRRIRCCLGIHSAVQSRLILKSVRRLR